MLRCENGGRRGVHGSGERNCAVGSSGVCLCAEELVGSDCRVAPVELQDGGPGGLGPFEGRRRRGIAIIEFLTSYGLYLVIVAAALGMGFMVWANVTAQQAYDGVNSIRGAAFRQSAGKSSFNGITSALIAESGKVESAVVGEDGESLFVSGFEVELRDGGLLPTGTGVNHLAGMGFGTGAANDARYLWMIIGAVDDSDACQTILNGVYGGQQLAALFDETFDFGTITVPR